MQQVPLALLLNSSSSEYSELPCCVGAALVLFAQAKINVVALLPGNRLDDRDALNFSKVSCETFLCKLTKLNPFQEVE